MRLTLTAAVSLYVLWSAAAAFGASAPTELTRAQQELEKVRALVSAGAAPRAQLEAAEKQLLEAQDEQVLRETLYGNLKVEDLTEDQANAMTQAAIRQLERQQARLDEMKAKVDAGVLTRLALAPFVEELDRRRRTVDLAQSRAHLIRELAEMARAEDAQDEELARAESEKFHGDGTLTAGEFQRLEVAFRKRFGEDLPVSARGETALHRTLGFNHRGRFDIAVSPDQSKGQWLRTYLESEAIPYIAFRRAVPGKATGAHFHVGPPSLRYRSAD